ncbi:MAG: PspC domain-containing protein [Acidimicrobiales bacterium]|jgi:signal transduction histidine kinase
MVAGRQRRDHRCITDQFNPWQQQHYFDSRRADRALRRGRYGRHRGHGRLQRSRENRMIGGVAGGIAARIGRDVTVVRIVLVLFGLVSGFGVAAYVLAWLFLPVEGSTETIAARALSDRQGITIVLALVPALVVILLLGSALHANFVSSWGTPLLVSAAGLVLVGRNADEEERAFLLDSVRALLQLGSEPRQSRRSFIARLGAGVMLFVLGVVVISERALSRSWFRPVVGTLLIAAGTVVLLGPWWFRLAMDLVHERQARIRAEERADMAARVHDSVLQTLAMIQRSADQPQEVAKLARAQERELRSWLFEGRAPGSFGAEGAATLSAGVEQIEREVEAAHGVAVDAVTVGDAPLDDELRALLEAGREATVNAAKWSGANSVSIYVEAEPKRVSMFVRDRGAGFDSEAVAGDRKGIAESIRGRMQRHGGTAVIRSVPGEGTEVELSVPRRPGRT